MKSLLAKPWILLGSVLLFSIGASIFWILPTIKHLQNASVAVLDARARLVTARTQQQNATATRREFDQLQTKAAQFDRYLITDTNALDLVSALEGAARGANVEYTLAQFTPKNTVTRSSTIQLTAAGTLPHLVAFLHTLELLPTPIAVTGLQFTNPTQSGDTHLTIDAMVTWQ